MFSLKTVNDGAKQMGETVSSITFSSFYTHFIYTLLASLSHIWLK